MFDESPYTHRQWVIAINMSALLGWAVTAVPIFLHTNLATLFWVAIIGIPIALAACWIFGALVLRRIMQDSVTWPAAAWWGGLIALFISLAGSILNRLYGLWTYFDPHSYSQIGGGEYVQEIDGILTSYGWLILAKSTVQFVLAGVIIALIVRGVIGPGRLDEAAVDQS